MKLNFSLLKLLFANFGLRNVGRPYSQAQLTAGVDDLDAFYISDCWSEDRPSNVVQLPLPSTLHKWLTPSLW
jgi:hypothetical protein